MQCHIGNCHIYCYSWQQKLLLRNQEKWVLLIFSLGILFKRIVNLCTFVIFEKMDFQVKCCVICVLERLTAVDWIKSAFLYLTLFRLAFVWFVATLQYYLGKVVHLSSGCCFNKATFIRYFPICPDNIRDNIEHFRLLLSTFNFNFALCFETCVMWPTFFCYLYCSLKMAKYTYWYLRLANVILQCVPIYYIDWISNTRVMSKSLFKTT